MARLIEKFQVIRVEVAVDPFDPFWLYHSEVDLDDPLSLLIRCEEGDEEALQLMYGK